MSQREFFCSRLAVDGIGAAVYTKYKKKGVSIVSAYSELIKNFEKIRVYMREFYVYGFKSRNDYDQKSARLYDDERRRMESWLGEHMQFVRTHDGKTMFLSIDSRVSEHNPLYKAWKAKSFTDRDITLHFILLDILYDSAEVLSLQEILSRMEPYFDGFDEPMSVDESTVRKKLREYAAEGMVIAEKQGRQTVYRRADSPDLPAETEALHFASEICPCGVIGSFLLDKYPAHADRMRFKHHYITSALDSDVLCMLLEAMQKKCVVTVMNSSRREAEPRQNRIVPLRVFISTQNGRQHLLAYQPDFNAIKSFRIDYLSDVKLLEPTPRFDELRAELDRMQAHMWGVTAKRHLDREERLESVSFTVRVADNEEHIVGRLHREKRCGTVEQLDEHTYRFTAQVYDAGEMIPWIRTFICRITELHFSNRTLENQFKHDLETLYALYGIGEVEV